MRAVGRVVVAGIGNLFLGDDGFGVEVANRLVATGAVGGSRVRIAEYGIRGLHLALDLLDGCDTLVLIDALPMGEPPGTVAVLEVDPEDLGEAPEVLDAHAMSPAAVLALLAGLGGSVRRVLVVGCQPALLDDGIGLTPEVAGAVPVALQVVMDVLEELEQEELPCG